MRVHFEEEGGKGGGGGGLSGREGREGNEDLGLLVKATKSWAMAWEQG